MDAKHILCYGDSNTWGCIGNWIETTVPSKRYDEQTRWPCVLQADLGENFRIVEEGLGGRSTIYTREGEEWKSGEMYLKPCLHSHRPLDLVIIMLGTNDTKERLGASAACIGIGMERLVMKAKSIPAWRDDKPNILIICPPHIGEGMYDNECGLTMGAGCPKKSRELAPFYEAVAQRQGCAFLDAEGIAEFNHVDWMHLTRKGHADLAAHLSSLIPTLV